MTPDPGYTVCHRHPRKVAVQNCKLCARPICTQCASESGDPLFCLPCKQDTMLHGDRLLEEERPPREARPPEAAPVEKQDSQPVASRAPFQMGEVTVFDDGTVAQPGAPPTDAHRLEDHAGGQGTPPTPPPAVEQVDADSLFQAKPAAAEPTPVVTAAPAGETRKKQTASKAEKPVMGRPPGTGVSSQLLYATRYAATAAALITAAWLLIAFGTKQWTQISVFTLGMAVPWALYNSTTRKKYMGARVWTERPPLIFISAISFLIVIIFAVAMEFLARWVIFGNRYPVSDFLQRYFKATDWLFVVCGLALAALTPYVLKLGAEVAAPSLKIKGASRSKKGEAEQVEREADREPDQKPGEKAEPDAVDETRPDSGNMEPDAINKIRPGPRNGSTDEGSKPVKWR